MQNPGIMGSSLDPQNVQACISTKVPEPVELGCYCHVCVVAAVAAAVVFADN